jgi:hypothetical protein
MLHRFIVAAVPGIILYIVSRYVAMDSIISLAVAGIAYFTVYFGACAILRLVTLDDIRSLLGRR